MIDIFGPGPFLNAYELLIGSFAEFGIFYARFLIFSIIIIVVKHFKSRRIALLISLLLPIGQIIYIGLSSIKSESIISIYLALLITSQVWTLKLLPFEKIDYIFLFSVASFPSRFFDYTSALLGNLWIFWILFSTVYATAKIGLKQIKGNHFICYFLFVFLSLSTYSFTLIFTLFYPFISKIINSSAIGLLIAIFVTFCFFILVTLLIKNKFYDKLQQLNQLGKKYHSLEIYFFIFSILILIFFSAVFLPFSFLQLHNIPILLLIPALCLGVLWAQIPFIILLFRISFYKDTVAFNQWEKEITANYYNDLSSNLNQMHEIRHDIKNIFFTMGNFVERSNDEEMKTFFWKQIYPYSLTTIQQNELLSKLYQLPIESLRAFFHLKISQALNQKIKVSLMINILPDTFEVGMDIIDLNRILGILLDNAIEETVKTKAGVIEIKIIGNNKSYSYIIKNPITPQTQIMGIHAGVSTKGLQRGNGLKIVKNILKQYNNITLNSTIQNSIYIQSLNIDIRVL